MPKSTNIKDLHNDPSPPYKTLSDAFKDSFQHKPNAVTFGQFSHDIPSDKDDEDDLKCYGYNTLQGYIEIGYDMEKQWCCMYRVFLKTEYQRQGIFTALLNEMKSQEWIKRIEIFGITSQAMDNLMKKLKFRNQGGDCYWVRR